MNILKPLITAALLCVAAFGQSTNDLPNLGRFERIHALEWDASPVSESVRIYSIYVGPTNMSSFTRISEVTTNRWTWNGPNIPALDGTRAVYLTASSLAGETLPSKPFILDFRFGATTPPQNPRKVTNVVVVP